MSHLNRKMLVGKERLYSSANKAMTIKKAIFQHFEKKSNTEDGYHRTLLSTSFEPLRANTLGKAVLRLRYFSSFS